MFRNLFYLTIVFVTAQSLPAQTPTAQMTGRVTDPTGAVIAGANIALKNTETSGAR